MSSTLAGNLAVLGSVANLIVVQRARSRFVIDFWEYARAGVPSPFDVGRRYRSAALTLVTAGCKRIREMRLGAQSNQRTSRRVLCVSAALRELIETASH
jgi:hypothetical protein